MIVLANLTDQVPNIDDVARWLGPPARIPEPTGVYEGGGTGGLISEIQRPSTVKEMPMAKAFKVGFRLSLTDAGVW